MLNAKRQRKGVWLAKCPAHPDNTPSLTIREGRRALLLKCWSHNCNIAAICDSLGIKQSALWYEQNADPKAIREAERKRKAEEWKAKQESRKAAALVDSFRLAERRCCELAMQRKADRMNVGLQAEYHSSVQRALILLDRVNLVVPFIKNPTQLEIGRI